MEEKGRNVVADADQPSVVCVEHWWRSSGGWACWGLLGLAGAGRVGGRAKATKKQKLIARDLEVEYVVIVSLVKRRVLITAIAWSLLRSHPYSLLATLVG